MVCCFSLLGEVNLGTKFLYRNVEYFFLIGVQCTGGQKGSAEREAGWVPCVYLKKNGFFSHTCLSYSFIVKSVLLNVVDGMKS